VVRLVIGSILGGIAQFFIGFIFWGTPLNRIAFKALGDVQSADLQAALARNLTVTGTGTYSVPWTGSQQGTALFGQGPIATIHFNTSGFPALDSASLIAGLILSIVTAFLIGMVLHGVAHRVTALAERMRIVVLFAAAAVLYLDLGQPVYNHFGWPYFIYSGLCDLIGLIVAGLVIAKWFLPNPTSTVDRV